MTGAAGASAEALVECVRSAGYEGPILLVARCDDVGRDAPSWAAAFSRAGLEHRVRVVSAIAESPSPPEIDDIVAESASLPAALVVVVSDEAGDSRDARPADLAARIHAAAGRPAAVWHGARRTLALLPDVR